MRTLDLGGEPEKKKKKNKYGAIKTEYNGVIFDSKKEAEYAEGLDMCKRASKKNERVVSYEIQVQYDLHGIDGTRVAKYFADFVVKYADGTVKIIDVKSEYTKTPVYRLKKKLLKAEYGLDIVEE